MARITIKGTAARDNLFAPNPYSEIYEIFGFESNDTLGGGAGGDILDGGEGFDFASYQNATAPVRVDMLNMESNTGWAAGDEFRSIEGLIGSRYDDWLRGDNNNNIIDGWAGNDTIFAEGGNDIVRDAGGYDELHGGTDGFDPSAAAHPWAQFAVGDTLEYTAKAGSKLGITADLEAGYVIEHGFRTEDKVEGFEGIRGTEYDDTIYGREQSDVVLQGGAGVDTIYGRGGNDYINGGADGDVLYGEDGEDYIHGGTGDDTIVGGRGDDDLRGAGGTDTVSYADVEFVGETSDGDFLGVLVNLTDSGFDLMPANAAAVGTPFIGPVFGTEIDALSGIENVIGTRYRDDIYGNWQDNEFDGGAGTDFLFGHEGNDTLIGGEGDFLDWLIGGDDTDELLGGDGDDILDGGSGADQLLGGDGIDTAWYNGESDDSVTLWVSLANPAINTGYAQGDSYDSVENVVGTIRRDIIYGNDDDNRLDGREGSDSLYGNGGDDTLVGDSGFPWADYFYGGTGEDTVDYSELFNPDYTGVTVDLLDQSLNAGLATNDQFYSIENIFAPAQGAGSTLSGDDALNELRGGVGGDRLMGRGSFDTLIGNGGTDTAVFRGDIDDYAIRWLYPYGRPIEERFLEVTDLAANRDGTDYVIGIEQLEFNGVVYSTSDWMII